jgi:Uma2 family endonuclease
MTREGENGGHQSAENAPALDTIDDFLAWLPTQHGRYEFVDGRIVAMAGGSERHNDIQVNLLLAVGTRLRGGPCKVNGPDLLVRTDRPGRRGRFPDASVSCGREGGGYITRPVVIFEVLSEETELADRRDKRREYHSIPSLAHYVLVTQDVPRVEVYSRKDGRWLFAEIEGSEATLPLDPPGIELPLSEIYAGLELPGAGADSGFPAP